MEATLGVVRKVCLSPVSVDHSNKSAAVKPSPTFPPLGEQHAMQFRDM